MDKNQIEQDVKTVIDGSEAKAGTPAELAGREALARLVAGALNNLERIATALEKLQASGYGVG